MRACCRIGDQRQAIALADALLEEPLLGLRIGGLLPCLGPWMIVTSELTAAAAAASVFDKRTRMLMTRRARERLVHQCMNQWWSDDNGLPKIAYLREAARPVVELVERKWSEVLTRLLRVAETFVDRDPASPEYTVEHRHYAVSCIVNAATALGPDHVSWAEATFQFSRSLQ